MATGQTNTATTSIAAQIQKYFNPKLLAHAQHELYLSQFGQKAKLPQNAGSKTIVWTRAMKADASAVVTLTEGTPIGTIEQMSVEQVEATLFQIGNVIETSDILGLVGMIDYLSTVGIPHLGENAALYLDTLIRNIVCHPSTGLHKRYAQGLADFATLAATGTNAAGKMTVRDVLGAATYLKNQKAPRLNGGYVAVVAPSVAGDLMDDSKWINVKSYSDATDLYNGEIGRIYGVRIVEGTNPFQEDETEGTFADTFSGAGTNTTGLIYSSVFAGADAYGVVDIAAQGITSPKVIINDKADKSDPLNQKKQAGWKAYTQGAVLNPVFGTVVRSKADIA